MQTAPPFTAPPPNEAAPRAALEILDEGLPAFVRQQLDQYGGNVVIEDGLWILLAVPASDRGLRDLAQRVLADARGAFAWEEGLTEDDAWMLYFVDAPNRPAAVHWLDDVARRIDGRLRSCSPAQRESIRELADSKMPHRIAQRFAEAHRSGDLAAGCVNEPAVVRTLLDRLHMREPLFFSAFHQLLAENLLDLVVLLEQLIPEDVELANESLRGSLSQDPFLRTRQAAAAEIRNILTRFHVISALDQQKNNAPTNPYAAYLDLLGSGDELLLPVDGTTIPTPRGQFLDAIHTIRRNLYRGGDFGQFDSQAPWMSNAIVYPFRFIKSRLGSHRELTPLDGLFMLERGVSARPFTSG